MLSFGYDECVALVGNRVQQLWVLAMRAQLAPHVADMRADDLLAAGAGRDLPDLLKERFGRDVLAGLPGRKFYPSAGVLERFRPPPESPHLRLETGVGEGDEISIHYDPMIAKLVAWGPDRDQALSRLKAGLEAFQLAGTANNVEFLAAVVGHPAFRAGQIDTGFIERHLDDLVPGPGPLPDRILALACLDILLARRASAARIRDQSGDPHSPWAEVDGWRLNDAGRDEVFLLDGEETIAVGVRYSSDGGFTLELPEGTIRAHGERLSGGDLRVDLAGASFTAAVVHHGQTMTVLDAGRSYRLGHHDPMAIGDIEFEDTGHVTAPLPGKVLQVLVAAGAEVKKGETLMVMEAMKMEHAIQAPADGVVAHVGFAEGDQVDEGAELIVFESGDG